MSKLSDEQLEKLRAHHTVWIPVEAGAPMLDIVYELRDPFDDKPSEPEVQQLIQIFTAYMAQADLAPGKYKLNNIWKKDHPDGVCQIGDGSYEMSIPAEDSFDFQLSREHLSLLKHANLRGPGLDCKRPYGDMTFYQLDMCNALGIEVRRDKENEPIFSEQQYTELDKLHGEMLFALEAFLQYGHLKI